MIFSLFMLLLSIISFLGDESKNALGKYNDAQLQEPNDFAKPSNTSQSKNGGKIQDFSKNAAMTETGSQFAKEIITESSRSRKTVRADLYNSRYEAANLREKPDKFSKSLAEVRNGTPVAVRAAREDQVGEIWCKVEVNGKIGWIYSKLLR